MSSDVVFKLAGLQTKSLTDGSLSHPLHAYRAVKHLFG